MVHQPDMSKPNALAFEDVVLEKPEKPLVVSGQLVSHDLTEDDLLFLESFSPKEQNRIFHKVYFTVNCLCGRKAKCHAGRPSPRAYACTAISRQSSGQSKYRYVESHKRVKSAN